MEFNIETQDGRTITRSIPLPKGSELSNVHDVLISHVIKESNDFLTLEVNRLQKS